MNHTINIYLNQETAEALDKLKKISNIPVAKMFSQLIFRALTENECTDVEQIKNTILDKSKQCKKLYHEIQELKSQLKKIKQLEKNQAFEKSIALKSQEDQKIARRNNIYQTFNEIMGREMTEAEYQDYLDSFTSGNANIFSFCDELKVREVIKDGV